MDIRLPESPLQKKYHEGRWYVFDLIRKKWVALTPEEEVRQRFLHYLIREKGVPSALISVEKAIVVLGMRRRYDLILHDRAGAPLMIAECKAPSVSIDQSVFDQVARYNISCRVPYLAVTNGIALYVCAIDFNSGTWRYLPLFPDYPDLLAGV